jgi:hypothetical protein
MIIVLSIANFFLLIYILVKISYQFRLCDAIYEKQKEYHHLHDERVTSLRDHMRIIEKTLWKVNDAVSRSDGTTCTDSAIKSLIAPLEEEIKGIHNCLFKITEIITIDTPKKQSKSKT